MRNNCFFGAKLARQVIFLHVLYAYSDTACVLLTVVGLPVCVCVCACSVSVARISMLLTAVIISFSKFYALLRILLHYRIRILQIQSYAYRRTLKPSVIWFKAKPSKLLIAIY